MPQNKKPDPNTILEWECDPYRMLKPEIESLLLDIHEEQVRLSKKGTPLDYRLVVSKQASAARQLLTVIRACNAYPYKRDIL